MMFRTLLLSTALALLPMAATATPGPAPDDAAAGQAAPTPLRRLEAGPAGWRFDGEYDRIRTRVYATAADAAGPTRLSVALQSAVSVMPEASRITVAVRGAVIADDLLATGRPDHSIDVDLPAGTLEPGWNEITLAASQRHRVDCSPAATFELWTRIDPARSGLTPASAASPSTWSDLGLAARDDGGRLPIRLRLFGDDPATAATGILAAAHAARLAGAGHPVVDVSPDAGEGPGLDVAVGPSAVLAMAGLEAQGEGVWLVPADGAGSRPTLLVSGIPGDGFAAALSAFAALPHEDRADTWPTGERVMTFADLGVPETNFSGRRWRSTFELDLPADSLLADYAAIAFNLEGAYAPGLDREAGLSIEVDGRLAAAGRFGNRDGAFFDGREIEVPLSAFRAGRNLVTLQADVPSAADGACDPRLQISGPPRLLVLPASTVTVPRLARMAELPDLGATLATGSSGVLSRPVTLALARRDAATVAAAATLFARMAVTAPEMPALRVFDGEPHGLPPDAVVVASRPDASAALLARFGIEPGALDAAWALRPASAPAVTGSLGGLVVGGPSGPGGASSLDAWHDMVDRDAGPAEAIIDTLKRFMSPVVDLAGLSPDRAPLPVSSSTRLLLVQTIGEGADGPTTLVLAPDPATLSAAVADLAAPAVWNRLDGGAALLTGPTSDLVVVPARDSRLVATKPVDVVNLRLATAAWFSRNPPVWVLLLVGSSVLVGLATFALVRRSGVRTGR